MRCDMTRTIDTRLSLLEMMDDDTDQIVIVINTLQDTISYISPDGDHHLLTDEEYQKVKDRDNITVVRLEYVTIDYPGKDGD